MTFYKKVICLANSRKLGGRCLAGMELVRNKLGAWIRPVSKHGNGELSLYDIQFDDGTTPELLDIVTIPLLKHAPHNYQSENYIIDNQEYWVKNGRLKSTLLNRLIDDIDTLWINEYHSSSGLNDRIPQSRAEEELGTSLALICPQSLSLVVQFEYNRNKVRANFQYNDEPYCLTVTDCKVENDYLNREPSTYQVTAENVHLCVSIGEPFQGYCYKLVAAIINLT